MNKYILGNNAHAQLSASINSSATTIALEEISASLSAALGDIIDSERVILLSMSDPAGTVHEIVEATGWNGGTSTITVVRGRDGTTAQTWDAGSKIEVRACKALLSGLHLGTGTNSLFIGGIAGFMQPGASDHSTGIGFDVQMYGEAERSVAIGSVAVDKPHAVAIGKGYASADNSVCIGCSEFFTDSPGAVLIGAGTQAYKGTNPGEDGNVVIGHSAISYSGSIAIGKSALSHGGVVIGNAANADGGSKAIIIGNNSSVNAGAGIVIANDCSIPVSDVVLIGVRHSVSNINPVTDSPGSVLIGAGANTEKGTEEGEDGSVTIGSNASTTHRSIAIGKNCYSYEGSISIGAEIQAYSENCVCIGHEVEGWGDHSISIGHKSNGSAEDTIAIGTEAEGYMCRVISLGGKSICEGRNGCAIGYGARGPWIHNAAHLAILPVQIKASELPTELEEDGIITRYAAAPLMTLATGILDLADNTDFQELPIPKRTTHGGAYVSFYPDRIDVIITHSDTPSGSPAIQVGTDDFTNIDSILADSAVTITAIRNRQSFVPDAPHGVNNIRVSTKTAGAGTLKCRVVITGYLVADE